VGSGKPASAGNLAAERAPFFAEFVEALFPMNYPSARALAGALDLTSASGPVSVLDLGAGSGVWGIALAQASPHVTVRAVDLPEVLPVTRRVAERFGLGDRLTTVGGDLLEAEFGGGHQVATLGQILHSEGVERSRALLRRTYAALAPGGTIAIAEHLVDADRRGPMSGLIFAVNMLVNTEAGGVYSFEEIAGWLTEAGFTNPRQLPAPGPSPLILADAKLTRSLFTRPRHGARFRPSAPRPRTASCSNRRGGIALKRRRPFPEFQQRTGHPAYWRRREHRGISGLSLTEFLKRCMPRSLGAGERIA
jgi:precorrin-6B methylase 2